jgi:hypothetical protein
MTVPAGHQAPPRSPITAMLAENMSSSAAMRSPYAVKNVEPVNHECAALTSKGAPCPLTGSYRLGGLWYCFRHLAVARALAEAAAKKS